VVGDSFMPLCQAFGDVHLEDQGKLMQQMVNDAAQLKRIPQHGSVALPNT
jgi:hypothetical protein